jgi:hypothetical protein
VAAPPSATVGRTDTFDVTLVSATGVPVAAESDIPFKISGSGFKTAETGVLRRGETSLTVPFTATAPGLADIEVSPSNGANDGTSVTYFVSITDDGGYKPEGPLSIELRVVPEPPLRSGQGIPRILATLLDKTRTPVSASTAIAVAFPEFQFRELLETHPLIIPKDAKYGEVRLRVAGAGTFTSRPVVTPNLLQGSKLSAGPDPMGFTVLGDIAGWRPFTLRPVLTGVFIPEVPVSIALVGQEGRDVQADTDLTAVLTVDPPEAGYLDQNRVTVRRGMKEAPVVYTPLREGSGTIRIEPTGLPGQSLEITFRYALLAFILVALVGGAAGGFIRRLRQDRKGVSGYVQDIVVGSVVGVLAFVLAPLVVSVGFKPPELQNGSKFLEALTWGFIGGAVGPAMFDSLIEGYQTKRSKTTKA